MESGLPAATTQLENRKRRFALRLLSLPRGDQAREVVGAPSEFGRRLTNTLAYSGRMERTVLLEEPESLGVALLEERGEAAKTEAEKTFTMFTDGSRMEDGAAGYAVVRGMGGSWAGDKTHMGYNQETYDAECAALARAQESASRRKMTPERVTILMVAQAAIRRMASDEPRHGQRYALQAQKHIAVLRRARLGIVIEIRWPGSQGNRRQREGRRVGEDCGGGARHPRGETPELLRPDRSAGDASPTVPR